VRRRIDLTFALPAELQGRVHVEARLEFRTLSEALSNELGLAPELGVALQLGEASADIQIGGVP
jgi:hypothetical protein